MKNIQLIILGTSILLVLFFVSCRSKGVDIDKMYIIIKNETSEHIYVGELLGIDSPDYLGTEKVYNCSMPIYYIGLISGDYEITNEVLPFEEKEIQIKKRPIDYRKYSYILNDDMSVTEVYEGECETISFRLLYSEKPFKRYLYYDYVDEMKVHGYYTIGYQEDDKIYFNIFEHQKIEN